MIEMKKNLLLLFFVIIPICLNARTVAPEWVSSTPNNSFYYWGVGVCDVSDPNHKEVARRTALEDIIRQISVKVESNSFLSMNETNLTIHESYQKQMRASSHAYLEDLQIFDTYQDKKNYYVCFRLSKEEYKAQKHAKGLEVAKTAYDYLSQARNAIVDGNITTAISLYHKGLEVVEPWLFLDLTYNAENVPVSLYSGYTSVFDGLNLILQPESTTARNFTDINEAIVATLQKDEMPLKNVPLTASFTDGAGRITPSVKTNMIGEGRFYLTQLLGKCNVHNIVISVDKNILKELPPAFQNFETIRKLPEAVFRVTVEHQHVVFYLNPVNNAIPPLSRQISSYLVNEHFEVTTDLEAATHIINISTGLQENGMVVGDLGNLDEWLASLVVGIKDRNGSVLTQYTDEGVRILVAENSSRTTVAQQAAKELTKRFKREFPKTLKRISIK